jgi:putative aldouronate transport system permease protein
MRIRLSRFDRIFVACIYIVLTLFTISFVLPLLQVITISVSPPEVVNQYGFHFIPMKFDFSGYKGVFENSSIWVAYKNTIVRTVLATTITILLTFMGAYPLAKKHLPHRKFWTTFIVLTMFFSGGLIPSYLLIKNLGMMNTIWVLVLPGAISTYMLLVTRSFLAALPESLEEAAKIDGANEMFILFRIVLPLSMPIIATVGLYAAVYNWNAWFDSMIYIQDAKKQVLQLVLRNILITGNDPLIEQMTGGNRQVINTETLKMAVLVVSILPILCVYPFLQKYFIQGALIGSVKG